MHAVSLLIVALGCAIFLSGLCKEKISLMLIGAGIAFGGTILWGVQ